MRTFRTTTETTTVPSTGRPSAKARTPDPSSASCNGLVVCLRASSSNPGGAARGSSFGPKMPRRRQASAVESPDVELRSTARTRPTLSACQAIGRRLAIAWMVRGHTFGSRWMGGTVRTTTNARIERALEQADRALDRMEHEAKKRPSAAAAYALVEIVGTAVAFGTAETVAGIVAGYAAYRFLGRRQQALRRRRDGDATSADR